MRVAIVHEWLETLAGSEKVLEEILGLFPDADLYSVVDWMDDDARKRLGGTKPRTTFIQRLPFSRNRFRSYLPLMPLAIEQLDLAGYELVISSSHAVAKGVMTGPDQVHICYCHTPMRYVWDSKPDYLRGAGALRRLATGCLLHYLRIWDFRSSAGVDQFIANSRYVAGRIAKSYRRDAIVVHPPVDTEFFQRFDDKEEYYFSASRFVPYKRLDVLIRAFNRMPDKTLLIAGDGPEWKRCSAIAGKNVKLLGHVSRLELRSLLQRARAFVFAAKEDFGIVVGEAQACGTPVLCYERGGASEIVTHGVTGLLFREQSSECLIETTQQFELRDFDPALIHGMAGRLSIERFRSEFCATVEATLGHRAGRRQTFDVPPDFVVQPGPPHAPRAVAHRR
jgi:glycosyltransferase involved in cell wall biosynthesis